MRRGVVRRATGALKLTLPHSVIMREDLHRKWIIDAIAARVKYGSDQTVFGRKELEYLKLELSKYEAPAQETS